MHIKTPRINRFFQYIGVLLLFCAQGTKAQVLEFEQNSPAVVWKQIKSEHFQLIFPQELDSMAREISREIERVQQFIGRDMDMPLKKISIVLQNKNLIPNGFVQLAPRKSEMYVTSPQDIEGINWLETLVLHELRHVVQMDKTTGKFTKPFLEQFAFALYGLILPSWFFEGDAVWMETRYSKMGRGKIPSWSLPLKVQVLENRNYSYQKNYLGSYKDITPGFYELGYQMIRKLKENYPGEEYSSIWESLSKNPIQFYKLNRAWKKETGYSTKTWHDETLKFLKKEWEREEVAQSPFFALNEKSSLYPENQRLPHTVNQKEILYIKQGAQKAPHIVLYNQENKKESVLKWLGFQIEPYFHYQDGWIVWDELRKNPRYNQEYYQVIVAFDIAKKKTIQVSSKSRLFSPVIFPKKNKIAAIENDESGNSFLVFLSLDKQEVTHKIAAPSGVYLQFPKFNETGSEVIMTASSNEGMSLFKFQMDSLEKADAGFIQLMPWQTQKLEKPSFKGENIIFKAHFEGVDEIFELKSGKINQITQSTYGAFEAHYDHESKGLWYSQYGKDGFRIGFNPNPDSIRNIEISEIQPSEPIEFEKSQVNQEKWQVEPYSWWKNSFNFHSLSLSTNEFADIFNQKLGVYWLSDDLLSQVKTRLGYEYNSEIRSSDFTGSLSFERYFPKLLVSYSNRGRLGSFKMPEKDRNSAEDSLLFGRWREHAIQGSIQIPLSFYYRNQIISTGFQAQTSYTKRYNLDQPLLKEKFIDEILFPLNYQFYFNHYLRRAPMDLAPRWGYHVSMIYKHLPFANRIKGESLSFRSTAYLPGLLRNHAFTARWNAQKKWGNYLNTDDIPLVNGYSYLKPTRVYNTVLTQYMLPVAYPDWELGNLMYIKRIRAAGFADFENLSMSSNIDPRTYGFSLHFDTQLFRYVLPNFEWSGRLIFPTNQAERSRNPLIFTYGLNISY